MVKRPISKSKFVIAFALTFVIFIIGILLGVFISELRASNLESLIEDQNLDLDSFQLQYSYISDTVEKENDCIVVYQSLEENVVVLNDAADKLNKFISESNNDFRGYASLRRNYILSQLRYWLLTEKFKNICELDVVSVLYFFSNSECYNCDTQGFVLDNLKYDLGDRFLVFAIEGDFAEEPMVNIVKSSYYVDKFPTLIINNEKFDKFMDRDVLLKEICSVYKNKPDVCENG